MHAKLLRAGVCHIEEALVEVEPDHVAAGAGEPVRDPPLAAGHVQDGEAGLELEQSLEELRLLLGPLVLEIPAVEVEIVGTENVVPIALAHPAGSGSGVAVRRRRETRSASPSAR